MWPRLATSALLCRLGDKVTCELPPPCQFGSQKTLGFPPDYAYCPSPVASCFFFNHRAPGHMWPPACHLPTHRDAHAPGQVFSVYGQPGQVVIPVSSICTLAGPRSRAAPVQLLETAGL